MKHAYLLIFFLIMVPIENSLSLDECKYWEIDDHIINDMGKEMGNNLLNSLVTVISPNGGERWSGIQTIRWDYEIFTGCYCTFFNIYCVNDNSYTLATHIEDVSYTWDTTHVQDGYYKIKIERWCHSDYNCNDDPSLVDGDMSDGYFMIDNNDPPYAPTEPQGPSSGIIEEILTFSTSTIDPNGDDVKYGWDWNGDGTVDEWTKFYKSGEKIHTSHSWDNIGTYNIQVITVDRKWEYSDYSPEKQVTISINNPPYPPSNPIPADGENNVDHIVNLSWTGGDLDNDDMVTYDVYFGTTVTPPKVWENISSKFTNNISLKFNTKYYWRIVAWDNHKASTLGNLWNFNTRYNNPPNRPTCIYQKRNDEVVVCTTDPDGHKVRYGVSWENDKTINEWTAFHNSGKNVKIDCNGRTGIIGVIAEDEYGAQSAWVSAESKTKQYINTPFPRFLEQHLYLFPFLRYIFGL